MSFVQIKKNDIVDILSIASPCSVKEVEKIKKYLSSINLTPRFLDEKILTSKQKLDHDFPIFNAITRFEHFKKVLENKDSKIIWCIRGGYGSAEILPFLNSLKTIKQRKIFIGFSDISSINIFLIQRWKWQVICAPMLSQIVNNLVSKKSQTAIKQLIFGEKLSLKYQLEKLNKFDFNQEISSEIVGGCLSVIINHFATKNQINWKNKILFLEDEGEDGERLDRYFHQIVTIIIESKNQPKAIVLGNFFEANDYGNPKSKKVMIAIKRFADKLSSIPIFIEKTNCLGHSKNMMPLALGKKSKITKDNLLLQKF